MPGIWALCIFSIKLFLWKKRLAARTNYMRWRLRMVEIKKEMSEFVRDKYPNVYIAKTRNKYYVPEFDWLLRAIAQHEKSLRDKEQSNG